MPQQKSEVVARSCVDVSLHPLRCSARLRASIALPQAHARAEVDTNAAPVCCARPACRMAGSGRHASTPPSLCDIEPAQRSCDTEPIRLQASGAAAATLSAPSRTPRMRALAGPCGPHAEGCGGSGWRPAAASEVAGAVSGTRTAQPVRRLAAEGPGSANGGVRSTGTPSGHRVVVWQFRALCGRSTAQNWWY